jgi:hypothetical protein
MQTFRFFFISLRKQKPLKALKKFYPLKHLFLAPEKFLFPANFSLLVLALPRFEQ